MFLKKEAAKKPVKEVKKVAEKILIKCLVCNGTGLVNDRTELCSACEGSGKVEK